MTDILAACADGENLFIESVCQTVFSVGEILDILSDPGMSPERKRPFARFLVSVYMNTGGDKNQSGAADLEDSRYVCWHSTTTSCQLYPASCLEKHVYQLTQVVAQTIIIIYHDSNNYLYLTLILSVKGNVGLPRAPCHSTRKHR